MLRSFLDRFRPPVRGWVYVADVEKGPMETAAPGARVRNPNRQPAWIVVDHSLQSVLVAQWPGKLWHVEIIEKAPEQPGAQAPYTPAVAVRVLQQEPVAQLFGPNGEAVCAIIERARRLSLEEARALSRAATDDIRAAYSRAWDAWLADIEPASIHRGDEQVGTLAIPRRGRETSSPVGRGFSVLSSVFDARLRRLVGESAFTQDDEGETHLAEEWARSLDALLGAAMACGAPQLVSSSDSGILTSACAKVFS